MNAKQRAAEAAIEHVRSGQVVGLGTGSTADYFLQALSAAIARGLLRDIRGVPTSIQSDRRARELDIPVISLADHPEPDVTVDGADEIDPRLELIKGLGGALLREKIVAQNSRKLIIIADAGKRVQRLGTKSPLPVEVIPFGHETQERFLAALGCTPAIRKAPDGRVFTTDNGNLIYDCRFTEGIKDASVLSEALGNRAGVVESGLFLGLATVAIVATDNSVETLHRERLPG
jgi:ribose 5-phosphate isomerase A